MTTVVARGVWKELKGDLQQTWSKLTDDDIRYLHGNAEEIIQKIQKAYGFTLERAVREFESFKSSHSNYFRDERDLSVKEESMGSLNSSFENQDINEEAIGPAKRYLEKAKDLAESAVTQSGDFVRTYPGYTILGATALGFLAGAYFSRKRKYN